MTAENLVDYFLNNDLEFAVARQDINTLADAVAADFPDIVVPFNVIEDAMKLAAADNYIVTMITPVFGTK